MSESMNERVKGNNNAKKTSKLTETHTHTYTQSGGKIEREDKKKRHPDENLSPAWIANGYQILRSG